MERTQQRAYVLGSDAVFTIVGNSKFVNEQLLQKLWVIVSDFEKKFSRFLPDSELTHLNNDSGKSTSISPQLYELLVEAKKLSIETDGIYNPFILPSLQQAGYIGSWPSPSVGKARTNYSNRKPYNISHLVLTPSHATIPKNSALDFGGIGKGYLLDKLASVIPNSIDGYWLSIGGDILCDGADLLGKQWAIGVEDLVESNNILKTIYNRKKQLAIATSGITKRRGQKDQKSWHHIIDPRTNAPVVNNLLAVTVVTPKATQADVYAKCLLVVGEENSKNFLKDKDILDTIFQRKSIAHRNIGQV